MKRAPRISIIVTTKNEENNIANCLRSIKEQTYPSIELIVVDNFSNDNTIQIAKTFTEHVFSRGPERSAQRNFGVSVATGSYVMYIDADMILSKEVVTECVENCESGKHIAAYVPETVIGEGFWIKVRNFEKALYNGTCISAVRFINREKFLQIKGFDEELTAAEDWDLDRRIKALGSCTTAVSPIYHNEGTFSIKWFLGKKTYYSESVSKYLRKWGKNDPILKKQLGARYRLIGVFTENGKWKKLIGHPLLTAGMYWLRLTVGLTYLRNKR